jgi:ribosomal protein S18 acetylase RimI-like enzyme
MVRIRFEPMEEEDYQRSLERGIPFYANQLVERGLCQKDRALEVSQSDFEQLLPQGLRTPHRHLCNVVDDMTGDHVGEAWYTARDRGGTVEFWIDWIWIEPTYRRRGFATAALRHLEDEARKVGADRTGLSVWLDNPSAVALYAKLGYVISNVRMTKFLVHAVDGGPR